MEYGREATAFPVMCSNFPASDTSVLALTGMWCTESTTYSPNDHLTFALREGKDEW